MSGGGLPDHTGANGATAWIGTVLCPPTAPLLRGIDNDRSAGTASEKRREVRACGASDERRDPGCVSRSRSAGALGGVEIACPAWRALGALAWLDPRRASCSCKSVSGGDDSLADVGCPGRRKCRTEEAGLLVASRIAAFGPPYNFRRSHSAHGIQL